jgi:hypothetical protein
MSVVINGNEKGPNNFSQLSKQRIHLGKNALLKKIRRFVSIISEPSQKYEKKLVFHIVP